jgi:hypothetical protein
VSAQIIQLHGPRTCLGCKHFSTGSAENVETTCVQWAEPIDDETIGATCLDYHHEGTRT